MAENLLRGATGIVGVIVARRLVRSRGWFEKPL
jgi:hypothetical protein